MPRSRVSDSDSSSDSDDNGTNYKRSHKTAKDSRATEPSVRSTICLAETSSSVRRSFTPPQPSTSTAVPTQDNISRLELLVEKLIEQNVSQGPVRKSYIKPDCIPEFSPGNPNLSCAKWIEKIEQLAKINGWSERATAFHMQSRLTGLARKWYDNLPTYDLSWADWKCRLLKSFPEHQDYATINRKMMNRYKKPTETWEEYYFSKLELINSCEISPRNAVSCLIDGITDPTIQVGTRAGRYDTPDRLYAEYLSSLKPDNSNNSAFSSRKRFMTNEPRSRFEQPSKKVKYVEKRNEQKCYNCKMRGHFASNCPKPKIECTVCKRLGHLGKDCSRRVVKHQFTESNGKSYNDAYFLDCLVNGMKTRAYVDTGCGSVLIKEEAAQTLGLKYSPSTTVITGYGGATVSAIGEVEIDLTLDHARANVKALVTPNYVQDVPVMVGQPFLNSAEVVVLIVGGKVRIVAPDDDLNDVLDLKARKIPLWARKNVVIPP
ncbi:hypothetical protein NQ315_006042 [Exocentrus adspersus]|uniref:CCHC-type domain-containing protein n=1 Tax=Exocentrus adspersus TaxID=1586481 RepID=A0AAV8VFW9_9CUCU|nr:hypothetical protein NQ315_006042 [Exocentrus adspersus]